MRTKKDTEFKSKGVGVKNDTKPISVMLPDELDAYVRSKPNRSEWLRQVIAEAMNRELGKSREQA